MATPPDRPPASWHVGMKVRMTESYCKQLPDGHVGVISDIEHRSGNTSLVRLKGIAARCYWYRMEAVTIIKTITSQGKITI